MKKRLIKMTKRFLIILLVIIFFLLIIPYKNKKIVTMYSLDGDKIQVEFNLNWRSVILNYIGIRGDIVIDGQKYISLNDTNLSSNQKSFMYNFLSLVKNEKISTMFYIENFSPIGIFDNFVDLLYVNKDFTNISILVKNKESVMVYYGPASSIEDAYEIHQKNNK